MSDEREETYEEYCERKEAHEDAEAANYLRSRGYLIIPPGDPSPLGELVRASVAAHTTDMDHWHALDMLVKEVDEQSKARAMQTCAAANEAVNALHAAADSAAQAPAVKAWAERGR